jgi:hypothetical protein
LPSWASYSVTREGEVPRSYHACGLGPRLPAAREVSQNIEDGATVYTDALKSYAKLDLYYQHKVIDHAEKYVDGVVHTNGLENYWSLVKRADPWYLRQRRAIPPVSITWTNRRSASTSRSESDGTLLR